MRVIEGRNAHEILPEALEILFRDGYRRPSRAGFVTVYPGPVATVYERPLERVVFWPRRDANPFFHLFEALWMLAGRNDVAFPARFVSRMREFSDDGRTLHGAYGERWANLTGDGRNQLHIVAAALADNPDCRRQVISMWSPDRDLDSLSRDVPCNTQAYASVGADGRLDLTVCCRSNDVVWGCYGSDSVCFGFLLEYLAAWSGRPAGAYTQVSNNWHGYDSTAIPLKDAFAGDMTTLMQPSPYRSGDVSPTPLISKPGRWDEELVEFFAAVDEGMMEEDLFSEPFFRDVAAPMWNAHLTWGLTRDAVLAIDELSAGTDDWHAAGRAWIARKDALRRSRSQR